ncbi:hypothetical protein KBC77_04460 [Candidatus Saccharibacteria bacterium]|nr:hypothetical protein [Candidatus Saccharibacteria bacterium]
MIQFNLLPDAKLEYLKAERTKKLLVTSSFIAGAVALALLVVAAMVVYGVQRQHLSDLNDDIKSYTSEIKGTKDLDTLLTVQNQLGALTGLHEQKPVASRLFNFIGQVTPAEVSINTLNIDFAANTLSIGGTAPSIDAMRVYADSLKTTQYSTGASSTKQFAFSEVVVGSFAKSEKGTTFTINLKYDPALFLFTNDITLDVKKGKKNEQEQLFNQGTN